MKLGIYGLKDDNSILSTFTFGDDEEKISKWYLAQFKNVLKSLDDKDKFNFFYLQTKKCKLVRIGYLDNESGELQNDFAILLDLKDFDFKKVNKDDN